MRTVSASRVVPRAAVMRFLALVAVASGQACLATDSTEPPVSPGEPGTASSAAGPSWSDPGRSALAASSRVDFEVDTARLRQGREIWDTLTATERKQVIADFKRHVTPHIDSALSAHDSASAQSADVSAASWSRHLRVSRGSEPVSPLGLSDTTATDQDRDGLTDALEAALAKGFDPVYHVSDGERTGVGFAEFADAVPQTVTDTYGSTPVRLKYRVRPLGIRVVPGIYIRYGFLQIDYLTLWNKDTGMPGPGPCDLLAPLIHYATLKKVHLAHDLDNEWSSTLVAARAVHAQQSSGTTAQTYHYNHDPRAYRAYFIRTAAHEDTPLDKTAYGYYGYGGLAYGGHTHLWLSRNKHATYTFNPDGEPIVAPVILRVAIDGLDFLWERYAEPRNWPRFWYYVFYFIIHMVFVTCFVEDFIEQGGKSGQYPTNVGELSYPADGMRFIQDTIRSGDDDNTSTLGYKLGKNLWSRFMRDPFWINPSLSSSATTTR